MKVAIKTRHAWLLALTAFAVLARDAVADVHAGDGAIARAQIIGLDLDAARATLAKGDANDPTIAYERARLAIYEGDCDAAAVTFADPQVAKLDEDSGLGDIARGCVRTIAATSVLEDKPNAIQIRFQDDADRALMPLLVDTIIKARNTLTHDLGVDWPRPTRVVVVRDLIALSAMTGLPYESATTTGTVGVAKWGRVTLLSPRASQHGFAWRDTLAHELTHLAVTRASGDRAPLWLQEGLAKREEIRWRAPGPFDDRPSPESVVAFGALKKIDIPLDKLGPSIAMLPSAEQAMVAFAEVTSFVRYMVTQIGDPATKLLLSTLRDGKTIDQAMPLATGADLKAWDAQWRTHLSTLGEAPPPALLAGEAKDANTVREHVRLAELLIGRHHEVDALTQLDWVNGAMLGDPHARYLKARALQATRAEDARRVLGAPADVSSSYAPWWAIRGELAAANADATAAADFVAAIAEDPFDVDATCESRDPAAKPGDPLCDAARANGAPDVGRE